MIESRKYKCVTAGWSCPFRAGGSGIGRVLGSSLAWEDRLPSLFPASISSDPVPFKVSFNATMDACAMSGEWRLGAPLRFLGTRLGLGDQKEASFWILTKPGSL